MIANNSYRSFIDAKLQAAEQHGFDPVWMPDWLFDFQKYLVEWSIRSGRSAIFADCGMGKTPMQLVWAENVVKKTNKPVLIVTPLAVSYQTVEEAEKFEIAAQRVRNGKIGRKKQIYITNYEQLEKFDSSKFGGVVCDESSAIKCFDSKRKDIVTRFMQKTPYRLLCTATAAPNDYVELGTSSEALGELGFRDMITQFFVQETSKDHLGWGRTKYRFRGHAEQPFWRWVCSWARACRKPSDLGFCDDKFILPPLNETEILIDCDKPREGMLFAIPAKTMDDHREESRLTLTERCERVAEEISSVNGDPSIAWCHLNNESDLIERLIPEAKQVKGSMPDEKKEELLLAFSHQELKVLVTKPKLGCWGLNWQHCSHVTMFPSYSFEQHYQAIRRCWRFGQTKPVTVKMITTEGQAGMIKSLHRKSEQSSALFDWIVGCMKDELSIRRDDYPANEPEALPAWMS